MYVDTEYAISYLRFAEILFHRQTPKGTTTDIQFD